MLPEEESEAIRRAREWLAPTPAPTKAEPEAPADLPLTEDADSAVWRLRERLNTMVSQAALVRAHKRRATALDTTDLESAFDDIVNPEGTPMRVLVASDTATILGSLVVGFGTNVATGDGAGANYGWMGIIAGAGLSLYALAMKYAKH